ncbi:hydroxypyruvate isomerase family protein [Nocardia sp. KC 131]|uniref:hydroxypyruvate isomerase family protein n=1 Tax=Nocardia arseniciresistens TaxID=3392119 RepID=UPI00398F8C42
MHRRPLAANCSMLFTELALLDRPAAAKAAGFDAIEFWWPWQQASPTDREVDAFVTAVRDAEVQLIGLNFFAGDLAGPDCGALSVPALSARFQENIAVAVGIGGQLGVPALNALYGNRIVGVDPKQQDGLAFENLSLAAKAADDIDAKVLIEAVSGTKPYPLRTADDAVAVVDRMRAAGHANTAFLLDMFHLVSNGDDIDLAITAHHDKIGHVQIADAPGRGEPGTGNIDFEHHLDVLEHYGYRGCVALEYKPSTADTVSSLQSLDLSVGGTQNSCIHGAVGDPQ